MKYFTRPKEHYYAPLIRVPLFKPTYSSEPGPGVATRMYLAEEEDHGRHEAGDYWYVPWLAATQRGGSRPKRWSSPNSNTTSLQNDLIWL